MKLLHITCSPRGLLSESAKLSQSIIDNLIVEFPSASIARRDLGLRSLSHVDEEYARSLADSSKIERHYARESSLAYSEELIGEIEDSDMLVIGTPIHNFTVPSVLKAWIDHVVRAKRTFGYSTEGKIGLLKDRPVFIAVAAGGVHFGDQASQPDFLSPYLKAILGTIGLHDVTFFRKQGLARGQHAIEMANLESKRSILDHFAKRYPS